MPMKSGVYRILNLKSSTAMTENHLGAVVGWRRQDTKDQQWFVQESGKGYQFRNVASGGYIAIACIADSDNKIYCSDYPTTWALVPNPEHRGHSHFSIMMGDTDRILDLSDWGNTANGTQISASSRIRHGNSPTQHMTWKFERIGDEAREELSAPAQGTGRTVDYHAEEMIKSQAAEIAFLRQLVLDSRQEVSRLLSQLERLQVSYENRVPNNAT
ncbi:unnamed protein product [Rhizoctonia solani]|uniref:Ricin B lectin domain-containing protein n=1 Tax=Rhizoctonia solani TaxID=456999 RepID=A0A8H3HFM9_9AGAM|nr:unnamed protein product [Rhizoctonia solani]